MNIYSVIYFLITAAMLSLVTGQGTSPIMWKQQHMQLMKSYPHLDSNKVDENRTNIW